MTPLVPNPRTLGLFEPFRREMESVFDRFFGDEHRHGTNSLYKWAPCVDVEETEKEVLVKADLPGIDPKDVEVSVADGVLTISGEKKEEKEEKKKNYHRVERFMGRFYRQVPLPAGVDADKVSATSARGVVTVTIPKRADAQPKKFVVTPKE